MTRFGPLAPAPSPANTPQSTMTRYTGSVDQGSAPASEWASWASKPAPLSNAAIPYGGSPHFSMSSLAQQIANAQYGPQQLIGNENISQLMSQLGQVPLNQQHQEASLRRDTSLAMQGLGLDSRSLGVDKNLTQKQIELQREQYANQLVQLGIDEATAKDMASRKTFDLRSDLTQRGALITVANERGTGRINRDLGYQLSGIATQRKQADISNRGTLASLNSQLTKIGLNLEGIGLSKQKLNNALTDGLYNIGLNAKDTIDKINSAIRSGQADQVQLGFQMLMSGLQYAGLPPDILAAISGQLGLGGQKQSTTLPGSRVPVR